MIIDVSRCITENTSACTRMHVDYGSFVPQHPTSIQELRLGPVLTVCNLHASKKAKIGKHRMGQGKGTNLWEYEKGWVFDDMYGGLWTMVSCLSQV